MALGQYIFNGSTNAFGRLLAIGSNRALSYAKTMLENPALIGGTVGFLNLEATNCTINGDAEVSENLIVGSQGKEYITDNIAPGPWKWDVTGYIPGNDAVDITNYFQPTLKFNISRLMQSYKKGERLTFKDCNCVPFKNVVIKHLAIDTVPDAQNRAPFSMTLQQIEVLTVDVGIDGAIREAAEMSGADGDTKDVGSSYTFKAKSDAKTLVNLTPQLTIK